MMRFTKKQKWVVPTIIFIAVIVAAVFVLIYYMRGAETYISNDNTIVTEAMICETKIPVDPYFHSAAAKTEDHKIKVVYTDDSLEKFEYDYLGIFDTEDQANSDRTLLSIWFSKNLSENNVSKGTIKSDFSSIDNTVRITLFNKREDINEYTAKFFFLNSDEYQKLNKMSIKTLKEIYANKGFTCKDKSSGQNNI